MQSSAHAPAALPAGMPWVGTAITLAGVSVPETVPDCGHCGVVAATCAGAADVAWHSQSVMPPLTFFWPIWMCAWATLPSSPS